MGWVCSFFRLRLFSLTGLKSLLFVLSVGASLLAKVANDDTGNLPPNCALRLFASKLAPTKSPTAKKNRPGRAHSPPSTPAHCGS
ncbi:hypothetical protein FJD34_07445 [Pseudomonas brenneri]|uniref:Uncharacterized protein n=1 Tax=Pseudomonas brenneri TaxID=129817 RepID=A0A5B2UXX0_9PSED|nr:hypothetical protein [Pseudomonas brenneri]KAA2231302.1 hypothetical protein F1720_10165 [Pseudomonas brenneri]TWR80108.1 hypothetical protein FJD34_07445 [Pseudomonas brenneri]